MSNPLHTSVTLRPEAIEDEAFLFNVYASTREEELEMTGWSLEMRTAFLNMQFKAMRQGYQGMFPLAQFAIILLNQQPVGLMAVNRTSEEIRMVDIALLPPFRSQGIGTHLTKQLLVEAAQKKIPVNLHVLQNNAAERLYQRLGFKAGELTGIYLAMSWSALPTKQRA